MSESRVKFLGSYRDAMDGTSAYPEPAPGLLPCGHSLVTLYVNLAPRHSHISKSPTQRYFCGECATHYGKHEPQMADHLHRRFGVGFK